MTDISAAAETPDTTPASPTETLRRRIKEVRRSRGMSAQALADAVQGLGGTLDRAAISKIEVDRRGVSLDEAVLLSAALDVDLSQSAADPFSDPTATASTDAPTATQTVARRVRQLRDQHGWSARQLARRRAEAGSDTLDQSVIHNLELGRRRSVSIDEVLTLALVLDVAPIHLFIPVEETAVTVGNQPVDAGILRRWVRGNTPLPSQDSRRYWTEIPDVEWEEQRRRLTFDPMTAAPN